MKWDEENPTVVVTKVIPASAEGDELVEGAVIVLTEHGHHLEQWKGYLRDDTTYKKRSFPQKSVKMREHKIEPRPPHKRRLERYNNFMESLEIQTLPWQG